MTPSLLRLWGGLGVGALLAGSLVQGCGASEAAKKKERVQAGARSAELAGGTAQKENHCKMKGPKYEVSEFDTSGDEIPDVRKVFLRLGEPPAMRLVLVCREVDLNADGRKDVVRNYTEEGRPLREEADRDFDGRMDAITYFEGGEIIRQELDADNDGRVDTKIFYEDGRPIRAERDVVNNAGSAEWQPDRWEYYEGGRLLRIGMDVDGDGTVDRWDRDVRAAQQQRTDEADTAAVTDSSGG